MFRESLQKMVERVEGAVAGILMGFDGISVEAYTRPLDSAGAGAGVPTDIQTIGMELAHVITQVRRAAELLGVGGLAEVTLRTERLLIIVEALNEEYFIAFAVKPDGNFGKARYVLRVTAPQIRAEL